LLRERYGSTESDFISQSFSDSGIHLEFLSSDNEMTENESRGNIGGSGNDSNDGNDGKTRFTEDSVDAMDHKREEATTLTINRQSEDIVQQLGKYVIGNPVDHGKK
jgi:hypothetical protein